MSSAINVVGFQYEPVRENIADDLVLDYDDNEDDIQNISSSLRFGKTAEEWCTCGNCKPMPTEKESLCCTEIEAIKYFHLGDKMCITHHKDFGSVMLLKNCLWTALVALHDRESLGLPQCDEVPNESYRYAAYDKDI